MKIFDAHFHIIDFKYPIVENNGYLPPKYDVLDYRKSKDELGITKGAIVSGSFQSFDQSYLVNALDSLGDGFYGVANIPIDITNKEIQVLTEKNVTAVRFNLKRGGSAPINHLEYLSNKLFEEFGWHTEFYLDSKDLKVLKPYLDKIQSFSIDHLGLSDKGISELYSWVEKGVKVKATGFGRVDFDPINVMKQIHQINPKALMFGTDLPSTRAKTPFSKADINRIQDHFSEEDQNCIFFDNANNWYSKSNS